MRGTVLLKGNKHSQVEFHSIWWFVPGIGLPAVMEIEDRTDSRLVRRHKHELTAYDVLGAGTITAK